MIRQTTWSGPTLPSATAEVAISSTKLSPFKPGAATEMGLVPKEGWKTQ